MKVVINGCYGGFGISDKAYEYMAAQGVPVVKYEANKYSDQRVIFDRTLDEDKDRTLWMGRYWDTYWGWMSHNNRDCPLLVQTVEALGDEASGHCAQLEVIEIPDDVDWYIHDYDGLESIHENHRSWG